MKKLATIDTPNIWEVVMAKSKFKLDGVRYRKLQTAKWNEYHVW
jgi:hypothetical protein